MRLPLFHFVLEIPYVSIRTSVMVHHVDMMRIEYIALLVSVWEWKWEFRVYDTIRRTYEKEDYPVPD